MILIVEVVASKTGVAGGVKPTKVILLLFIVTGLAHIAFEDTANDMIEPLAKPFAE